MSLSTAILPLLRAHTHTGPRSADVTPGAGEAEGIARGREKNLAPEFDSPPPAPPPPPPPPAERLTLASGVCSRARPPLYRKYRLLPAGPPLTSPRAGSLAAAPPGPTLPPAARSRASQPAAPRARLRPRPTRGGTRLPPAFGACTLRAGEPAPPPCGPKGVRGERRPTPAPGLSVALPSPISHTGHNLMSKPLHTRALGCHSQVTNFNPSLLSPERFRQSHF